MKVCCKCKKKPARRKQFDCRECHAEYNRGYSKKIYGSPKKLNGVERKLLREEEQKRKKLKIPLQPGYREMNRLRNGRLEADLDSVDWTKKK